MFPTIIIDLKHFGLLLDRGVNLKLTEEQLCLYFMAKFGFLFERRNVLEVKAAHVLCSIVQCYTEDFC